MDKQKVLNFIEHYKKSTVDMLNLIDTKSEYQERFNVTITMNGRTLTIGNNADLFDNMIALLYEEIEETPNYDLDFDKE